MNAYIGLVFDLLILVALAATIHQSLRLSREFAKLQSDRKAFEGLIAALNIASARAESAIKALKETATESGDSLQGKINAGRALTDELEIIIQAGDSLANRLSGSTSDKKPSATATPVAPAPSGELRSSVSGELRSRADRELLEALKARPPAER